MASHTVLIKGPAGSGKTEKLINTYIELEDKSVNTNSILVLVRNRRQSIIWRKRINIKKASAIRIQSYFGFIQGEIRKYWPLISSEIGGFISRMLEPCFLTTEVSQFILNRFVDDFRKDGRFSDTTSTSEKITIEALSVLSRAATSDMDINSIGKRLFQVNIKKDASRERLFNDLQDVLSKYVDFCRQGGYIDYFLAVEIYNKYLLDSQVYKERLNDEIKYLLVDGIEEAVPCEIKLISFISDNADKSMLTYCTDGAVSRKQGACPEYAEKAICDKCAEIIEFEQSYTCKPEFFDFSESVYQSLLDGGNDSGDGSGCRIHDATTRTVPTVITAVIRTELRSEMISMVCQEIEKLIKKGEKPEDIAVICPIVDNVLEYCLGSWFLKKGIDIVNLARTKSYMEDNFIRALVTLACLSHPQWNINPPGHDISNLLSMVLGLDPVRSALLAREVMAQKPFTLPEIQNLEFRERIGFMNTEKYYYLKNWIEDQRKEMVGGIDIFFQRAFRTILLRIPMIEAHVNSCRALIESAENFSKIVGPMIGNETGKAFVEILKKGIKPAETIIDLEQKQYSEGIIISTPYAYISSSMKRNIQIWLDISSETWYKSDAGQISNPYVFSPDWQEDQLWTDELDDKFRMIKCGTYAKRLIRACSKTIIFAESQYNQDGYENEGVLSEVIR